MKENEGYSRVQMLVDKAIKLADEDGSEELDQIITDHIQELLDQEDLLSDHILRPC